MTTASEREELTEEERYEIRRDEHLTHVDKALRVIDAHAADRAALVAQLEAANVLLHRVRHPVNCHDDPSDDIDVYLSDHPSPTPTHAALVAQVAELTRQRDEALEERVIIRDLADDWADQARSAEARLETVLDERNRRVDYLGAEVIRLPEALAAAERREKAANLDADHNGERAEAAEARVRELEARIAPVKTVWDAYQGTGRELHDALEALCGR